MQYRYVMTNDRLLARVSLQNIQFPGNYSLLGQMEVYFNNICLSCIFYCCGKQLLLKNMQHEFHSIRGT